MIIIVIIPDRYSFEVSIYPDSPVEDERNCWIELERFWIPRLGVTPPSDPPLYYANPYGREVPSILDAYPPLDDLYGYDYFDSPEYAEWLKTAGLPEHLSNADHFDYVRDHGDPVGDYE